MQEQREIDRFEDDGGRIVHMSDGRNLRREDVADYKMSHKGVHEVEQQGAPTGPVSHRLTQGGK
jgi:hypothetical protein